MADIVSDLLRRLARQLLDVSLLLGVANAREQISDLVRVHAGSRHLDWASPVEVVVTKGEGQLLDLKLVKARLIDRHIEVSRAHATLGSFNGYEEEIEFFVSTCGGGTFDEITINDTTTWWVLKFVTIENEEGLDDPLVDNDQGNLGAAGRLVVKVIEGMVELGELPVDNLLSLSSTDTITVNDNVSWQSILVILLEHMDRLLDHFLDRAGHNFLSLLLDYKVRIVLRQLRVDGSCETHDRVTAGMADIDTNKHGLHVVHLLGEFHVE